MVHRQNWYYQIKNRLFDYDFFVDFFSEKDYYCVIKTGIHFEGRFNPSII